MYYIVFLFLVIFSIPAQAKSITKWMISPEKSYINFEAIQMGAEIEGTFKKFDANILFAPEHLSESKVTVKVDIKSIYTDEKTRDATLKNADWFDINNYPTATFNCEKFKLVGGVPDNGDYICIGDLTILKTAKAIELPFHLDIKDNIANMTASLTINRLDFNLGKGDWLDTSVIKKEVKINIKIIATN